MTDRPPPAIRIRSRRFAWGERTFVMGILNMTPDSFSGDGLLGSTDPLEAAVARARRMVADGADLLDVGGESTRPGHAAVDVADESRRVVPVIEALRASLPEVPISVDTTKPEVAEAALAAGADLLNDVWGIAIDAPIARVAAAHGVPVVLMHNRHEPRYADVVAEVVDELAAAVERAVGLGVDRERIVVDPGIGFGKTAEQNLAVLRGLGGLRALGRPILLGTSRKSTLGRVLGGAPPEERLEATLATTALGVAAGVDIIRVHDVLANVRAARTADAIMRGTWRERPVGQGGPP